jgi:hypothetical protein
MPENLFKIWNTSKNQSVRTDKIVTGENVSFNLAGDEVIDVFESERGPTMMDQIETGLLKIIETTPGQTPPSVSIGVTPDQKDALNAANSPSDTNPLATMADLHGYDEQITKIVYVDGNRTDTYTAKGSIEKPFKTIGAAVAWATTHPGSVIKAAPGTYAENVLLPNLVSLHGEGIGYTQINGTLQTGTQNVTLRDFGVTGLLTIAGTAVVTDVYATGGAVIQADCQSFNFTIKPGAGVAALQSSGGLVTFDACSLESAGNVNTVLHTAGKLVLQSCQINGNEITKAVVKSTGGMLVAQLAFVVNSGGGNAIECDNGATTAPNALVDTLVGGNVICGTAATIVDAVYGSGTATGTVILAPITGSH